MKWLKALPVFLSALAVHVEAQNNSSLLEAALNDLPHCAVRSFSRTGVLRLIHLRLNASLRRYKNRPAR